VPQGDWVSSPKAIRRECKQNIADLLVELLGAGWRVRRAGHKYELYCPCGANGIRVKANGSPENDDTHAMRVRRQTDLCPDRHDLMPGSRPVRPS
jgi:hypothetical protein